MGQQEVSTVALKRALFDLKSMARTLIELESGLRSVLGFTETIQYEGVTFHVSDRFVIADLRPLAFLGLVEGVDQDVTPAIERLYERVAPLLMCRHEWTSQDRLEMGRLATLNGSLTDTALYHPQVCTWCTAYAQTGTLPLVGRGFKDQEGCVIDECGSTS